MVKMEDNTQNKDCRLCLLRDLADRDARNLYQYVVKAQNMLTESEKISNTEYEERLSICRFCSDLQNATCMQCGCYVELRALKKQVHCPHGKQKW